jgi:prophage antirepressor-like protein
MNELTAFQFEECQEVRTLQLDGEPWFVAKDVCDVLGLGNATEALRNLDDDEKFALSNSEGKMAGFDHATAGVNIINESGLYNLIFRSNKPEAKTFRKWVTSEVLPSIRKKGFYALPGLMEKTEALIQRQTALLDDPKKAAYAELEKFVRDNLEVDEKRIHTVSGWQLYHAYEKIAEHPLSQHELMFKIALDHPEFELKYRRKEWVFVRCCIKHFL